MERGGPSVFAYSYSNTIYERQGNGKWRKYDDDGPNQNSLWKYLSGRGYTEVSDREMVRLVPKRNMSYVIARLNQSSMRLLRRIPTDAPFRVYFWNADMVVTPFDGDEKYASRGHFDRSTLEHYKKLVCMLLYEKDFSNAATPTAGAFHNATCTVVPPCRFMELMLVKMAPSVLVARERQAAEGAIFTSISSVNTQRSDVATPAGVYTPSTTVSWDPKVRDFPNTIVPHVDDMLMVAHAQTLSGTRPLGWKSIEDERTMQIELRAYATIAKELTLTPVAEAAYAQFELGQRREKKDDEYLVDRLATTGAMKREKKRHRNELDCVQWGSCTLTIDSPWIMHAMYATDDKGRKVRLRYINEGTENVVFGIHEESGHVTGNYEDIAESILRVRKIRRRDDPSPKETEWEKQITKSLSTQGVVPEITSEPRVVACGYEHDATRMPMYNAGNLADTNKKRDKGGFNPYGVGDALVELYTRLSTVARCVDTKESNVVVNIKKIADSNGTTTRAFKIALIDTDGHRCTPLEHPARSGVLPYIGPVDLQDMVAVLTLIHKMANHHKPNLDNPMSFAAVSLLVLLVENARLGRNTYPSVKLAILAHFRLIWHFVQLYDAVPGRMESQKAQHILAHYSQYDQRDQRSVTLTLQNHVEALLKAGPRFANLPQDAAESNDKLHYRAYWTGEGRHIDDLRPARPGEGASHAVSYTDSSDTDSGADKDKAEMQLEIRKAIIAECGLADSDINVARFESHVDLAVERFRHPDKRTRPIESFGDVQMGITPRRAVMMFFSVDRITATAFVAVLTSRVRVFPRLVVYTGN
jgi:hypothetical protein